LTAAGTRAFDLALRLKYAGVAQQDMTVVLPTPLRAAKTGLKPKVQTRRQRSQTLKVEAARSAQLSAPVEEKSDVINRPPTTGFGIAKALDVAIRQTPAGETLFVVPTYTGLLEIHRELERRGLTPHYWEEKGP